MYHSNMLAEAFHLDVPDVLSVNQDASLFNIIESEKKPQQRTLATASLAHECNCFAGCRAKCDTLCDFSLAIVRKLHIFKLDRPFQILEGGSVRQILYFRGLLKDSHKFLIVDQLLCQARKPASYRGQRRQQLAPIRDQHHKITNFVLLLIGNLLRREESRTRKPVSQVQPLADPRASTLLIF